MKKAILISILALVLSGCNETENRSDAYGNFEAITTTISSEASGKLIFFNVKEGTKLDEGSLVAQIDTSSLVLKRKQLEATLESIPQKLKISLQDIAVLEKQKKNLLREQARFTRLVNKKAATQKQLDDIIGQIDVIDQQILAIESNTNNANRGILSEKAPIIAQINLIADQIEKSKVINPISGHVVLKLSEEHEMVQMGKPLYRIANLDTMTLKFYVDAVQLQNLKLGSPIEVLTDSGKADLLAHTGIINWIAESAEFTPKTIQTKEDRVNLVYGAKALVPNPNGLIKIGMPAEVNFTVVKK